MERSWNIGEDGSQPLWLQWWVVDRVWSGREFGVEERRDGARIRDQQPLKPGQVQPSRGQGSSLLTNSAASLYPGIRKGSY